MKTCSGIGIIDAHTHVFPQYAQLAVEVMDRCGVECSVTLAWHDGFGDGLRRQLDHFARFGGRFVLFGNVDFGRINESGFGDEAASGLVRDAAAGMRGLKIYKALGLEYAHSDGNLWRVNDPALWPIWAAAGEAGIPVLMHTADPSSFWEPVSGMNKWNGVLHGEYASWTYYRKGMPSRDELLAERNDMIAAHPKTTFICPHVGSKSETLDAAAEDLDALANLYYDVSARLDVMGRNARRAAGARQFIIDYQDRILFGTDLIYDDTNVPTGMQAQCLYQPGEFPLDGRNAIREYVRTSAEYFRSNLDFLAKDGVQECPPFRRTREPFTVRNLNLPPDVLEKVLYRNAKRLLGL
jgi:predicted TIM-barrel fold metal-dependent hydrolase